MANEIKLKKWNGSAWVQQYPEVRHTDIVASGTPSSSNFLRGDGAWANVGDGNTKFYAWRAINNTSSGGAGYYRIANINGQASTRFHIEITGRSQGYGDGNLPNYAKILGQYNNDNNYDVWVFNNKTGTSEVVQEVGIVDDGTNNVNIWVKVSSFAEVTATAYISDGTITTYDTNSLTTSAPTGYSTITEYIMWNSGNDGSGSGLAADTVDGIHGGSFLRSDTNDSASGDLTFTGDIIADGDIKSNSPVNTSAPISVKSLSNGRAIHIEETGTGSESWQLGVDTAGNLNFMNSGSGTPSIRFFDNDRVAIGVDTPTQKLDVAGSIKASDNLYAGRYYDLNNTSYYTDPASTSIINQLQVGLTGADYLTILGSNSLQFDRDGTSYIDQKGTGNLAFRFGSSYTTRMLLTNSGTLSVNGDTVATENYVDTEIASLVASAPSTLDTLNELAAALGDDANFSTTMTNSLAGKLNLTGGTLTGTLTTKAINMQNYNLSGVGVINFNDPGVNEGINWSNIKLYESPNNLSNAAGNFQVATGSTRLFTVQTNGDVDIPDGSLSVSDNVTIGGNTALHRDNRDDTYSYQDASDLAVGWYTIATNQGNRGIAKFGLRDTDSGRHQSVIFYAAHHYGNDNSNTITVLHNSAHGTTPFRKIRIKDGGTYDGAALQVYIDNANNNVRVLMLGDNFQSSGWVLKDWVADAIDPQNVSNYSSMTAKGQIDLDQIDQGGIATTGPIYAGDNMTQYRVLTTDDEGSGNGIDADTVDGQHLSALVRNTGGNTISGNQNFYGTDTSGSYSNAPIEIREVNLVTTNQSSEAYAPELAFHWGGRSQTSIWLSAQGKLNLAGNQTGEILTSNSTIDADTLGNVAIGSLLQKTGGTMSGDINFSDDGDGIGFYGDNAIKKVSGTGMVITTDSTRALDILLQLERGAGGTKYKVFHEGYKPSAVTSIRNFTNYVSSNGTTARQLALTKSLSIGDKIGLVVQSGSTSNYGTRSQEIIWVEVGTSSHTVQSSYYSTATNTARWYAFEVYITSAGALYIDDAVAWTNGAFGHSGSSSSAIYILDVLELA